MTSIINNQQATIDQLITPLVVGITTISPSLVPYSGALGWDKTTPDDLYLGNGSAWIPISASGGITVTDAVVGPFFMTSAGNPTLTVLLRLQKIVSATVAMVHWTLTVNTGIVATVPAVWVSPPAEVPAGYIPAVTFIYPIFTSVDGSFQSGNSILQIDNTGLISLIINFNYPASSVQFASYGGNYSL
jgi:hypothetical protein